VKFPRMIRLPLAGVATLAMLSGCGSTASPTEPGPGLDTTPPPAPTHLVYSHDAQGRPVLAWDASAAPDVASYDVYVYSPAPDRDSAYLLITSDANNNYVLPTVSTATEATYRVRAVDTSGNKSAFSAAVEIITAPAGGGGDFTPIDIP
jgi:uncharacterized protein YceK